MQTGIHPQLTTDWIGSTLWKSDDDDDDRSDDAFEVLTVMKIQVVVMC
jgi:hypothetical protein